jgi:hypothetical protein
MASDLVAPLLPLAPPLPLPELAELDSPLSVPVLLLLLDPPQAAARVMPTDNPKKMRAFFIRSPLGEPVAIGMDPDEGAVSGRRQGNSSFFGMISFPRRGGRGI